jgi:hypothetical protein
VTSRSPTSCHKAASCPGRPPTLDLVRGVRVDLAGRVPVGAEHGHAAREIPHARGDRASVACDPHHLSGSGGRIVDEVEDELRQRAVEAPVGEGEPLGGPDPDVRAGNIRTALGDERLGRVGGGNVIRADERGQDRGQRTRPAADVDDPLARCDARGAGKLVRERPAVAAHEALVGVGFLEENLIRAGRGHWVYETAASSTVAPSGTSTGWASPVSHMGPS